MRESNACPCGSDTTFSDCCQPIISGGQAPTPEALMRSRYSAYALSEWDYLLESWHPETRPAELSPADIDWLGLTIVSTSGETVEFVAAFRQGAKIMILHETSRFALVDNQWRYVDGDCRITEAGRNAPCPCGSGLKTKRCCGRRNP